MSNNFKFNLEMATQNDDQFLKSIIKNNYMESDITVSFQREPSYFESITVEGYEHFTIKADVVSDNKKECVGMGSVSYKKLFVNGEITNIGYLSGLRLNKEWRGSSLVARGYKMFKNIHEKEKKVKIYLTTIIEKNYIALKNLTGGKAGLPKYNDYGLYTTYAVNLFKKKKQKSIDIKIYRANINDIDEIVDCLNRNGRKKQFFPYYSKNDIINNTQLLKGLKLNDIYVAKKDDKIIGVCAKWDQSAFKQNIIINYKGVMKFIKPFYNFFAKINKFSPLPNPCESLNSFFIGLIAIDNDDIDVFRSLLTEIYNNEIKNNYNYFLVGLHERDILNRALKSFFSIKYKSRIFIVTYEDGVEYFNTLDDRIPYIELGSI